MVSPLLAFHPDQAADPRAEAPAVTEPEAPLAMMSPPATTMIGRIVIPHQPADVGAACPGR